MKNFVIDVSRCNGCYSCQIACKDEHCGNKPQPETGQFWGKIYEYVRGQIPQVKLNYVFVPCQHCVNAPCVDVCPVNGGIYTRDDGLVIIDPQKCTGCRACIDVCPYGCIYYNGNFAIAQKCTGCAHLLDRHEVFAPRCYDICTMEAISFGDETGLEISGTETLHPEYGLTTRVHYKNLPKRFIAGTVYDPTNKEVLVGANCTLTGEGETYSKTTNGFGDFWFDGIEAADFTLKIEKNGKIKTVEVSTKDQDISLGDIALS
jgi:Fe-S-cluster-containing dehydrogenase component